MTRKDTPSTVDATEAGGPAAAQSQPEPATAAATAESVEAADLYEPYPGADFFHGGRSHPAIAAMGRRLVQEGHWPHAHSPGPDWTNAHRGAFAAWQEELRPKGGGDTSGIPDRVAWDKLLVPRVSPRREG